MQTVAILPVKRFANAKRRLDGALASGARRALAEAMFSDVLTALRRCGAIDEILVVSADPGAQRIAEGYGVRAIDDPAESGQDQAVVRGAGVARELGAAQVLCLAGDCPLIDPGELETLLGKPRTAARFAVDRRPTATGPGRTRCCSRRRTRSSRATGRAASQRHLELAQAAGCRSRSPSCASLALDVDTPDDLAALQERLAGTPRRRRAHARDAPPAAAHESAEPLMLAARALEGLPEIAAGADLARADRRRAGCAAARRRRRGRRAQGGLEGGGSRAPARGGRRPASGRASWPPRTTRTRATCKSCSTSRASCCGPSAAC